MRNYFLYSLIFIFLIISCEKENEYQSEGTLTGYDFRKCMCCGGYFIDIEDSTYRFYQMPEDFSFSWESDTFPIEVLLDWQADSVLCLGDEILISKMIRKE